MIVVNVQNAPQGALLDAWTDFDRDGDLDWVIVTGSSNLAQMRWIENDGAGGSTSHLIDQLSGFRSIDLADLNGDGRLDIVLNRSAAEPLAWYKNLGEQGFDTRVLVAAAKSLGDVLVVDVDGDGDLDIVALSRYVSGNVWHEQLSPAQIGDFDGNGFVGGADLALWQTQFGQQGPQLAADANRNDAVDGGDLLAWQRHFGRKQEETMKGWALSVLTVSSDSCPTALPERSLNRRTRRRA